MHKNILRVNYILLLHLVCGKQIKCECDAKYIHHISFLSLFLLLWYIPLIK